MESPLISLIFYILPLPLSPPFQCWINWYLNYIDSDPKTKDLTIILVVFKYIFLKIPPTTLIGLLLNGIGSTTIYFSMSENNGFDINIGYLTLHGQVIIDLSNPKNHIFTLNSAALHIFTNHPRGHP